MADATDAQLPLLEKVTRHVFLVTLSISWPKMTYQIADAVVEVANGDDTTEEIDKEFRSDPRWTLMPATWRKRIVNWEGRARKLLDQASVRFEAKGISVLPVVRATEVFAGLQKMRTEMETIRDEFVAEYTEILAQLKDRLSDALYKKAAKRLPAADEVAEKFSIVWAIIPMGGPGNIRSDDLDVLELTIRALSIDAESEETVAAALEILEKARTQVETRELTDEQAAELVTEAHDQMHKFTQRMLDDMSKEPREMLCKAADNLLEALQDTNRVVRNGTLEQVRRAFEMVEGFAFLTGPELVKRIGKCRKRLDAVTPQQLNSDAEVGARLAAGLRGVRDEAADVKAAATAVRRFRGIRIRRRANADGD